MQGYVVAKGNRFYAVIYDGIDPLTGRERRQWHPAGADRRDAELMARRLGHQANAPTRDCGLGLSTETGGKPLQREFAGYHSARRGAYRIMYRILHDDHVVRVVRIEHRADVYRTR